MRVKRFACLIGVAAVLVVGRSAMAQQGQEDAGAYSMGAQGRMVRGTILAAAGDKLTLKTEEGEVFQVLTTANTRLMKDRQPVKMADVHVGDGAGAMGVIDGSTKTIHAVAVMVIDAAQVKKMREDMGKTYISGKVMAIEDLELTIKRQDGVTQKIAVDEGTSFKRGGRGAGAMMRGDGSQNVGMGPDAGQKTSGGGESITLADVKVGDMVVGPGALKAGVFVPTQLAVIDAAAMGRRRRPEGDAAAGTPATPTAH